MEKAIFVRTRNTAMQHTIQINTSQLDAKFLTSIKSLFGKRDIKIIVEDVDVNNSDSTDLETKRFLAHRENHPSVIISDKRDFNSVVDDINI
ncbi:hypothetical protein MUK70_24300 [Dyadobacter chenwenxiniae]|uniref:Uncharacterized protein n=1 Tax=Dyadobacter chenwenxiniae TaxID=2906456 RepID=A0A9X1PS19_9BACT|nr:hypothetical protein [Dyadobacter chenwenxiniae]MCF0065435.1 hypothetical protein [Dyadobacter chenwenxiniae]UON82156.1 hypothetical protein MUK70_24300 [Dyadobacter chenwenxiniae]